MTKSKNVQAPAGQGKLEEYAFKTAAGRYTTQQVMEYAAKVKAAFDDRIKFEITSSPSGSANLPIVEKLNKRLETISLPDVTRGLMELGADPNFINHTMSKDGNGARFNIYAIDKAIKLVKFLMSTDKVPAVLFACLKSMINFKAAGETFTREFAEAAVCDKIRLEPSAGAKLLMRHTVDKSTASTQTSSNMRVLASLGLIKVNGSARAASYEFADTDQAKYLQKLVAA
jgi:hypothetical protein